MDEQGFRRRMDASRKTHVITDAELDPLLAQAARAYASSFDGRVWFERSVFINWTCAIADCKYCYLSTKPKLQKHAVRSKASILAELLICKVMGWRVGYITGGLRVESRTYLCDLMHDINMVLRGVGNGKMGRTAQRIKMNFGPYHETEVKQFAPHISGMGCAIESFDEELHRYICPSKPLKSLLALLATLKNFQLEKFITIILGMGELRDDVFTVIEKIREYDIEMVQLCFLKPQEGTVFSEVETPDPCYMAWWIAQLRIAHPGLIIKIALVRDRISDLSLYLRAGANCFSRFMVMGDYGGPLAEELVTQCRKEGRTLEGQFTGRPDSDSLDRACASLPFDDVLNHEIRKKAKQYGNKLMRLAERAEVTSQKDALFFAKR